MKFPVPKSSLLAGFTASLVATATLGFAFAQTPSTPGPSTPKPAAAALSDELPVPPAPAPETSKSWVLMDYATGQILAGENVDTPVEPASITKVMPSYVIAPRWPPARSSAPTR